MQRIIESIKSHIDPFSSTTEPTVLCNIVTGRAASSNVADFLLNIQEKGEMKKTQFLKECDVDKQRFDKPIKRTPILNFASDCLKKSQKSKNGTSQAIIKMKRDLLGRLLGIPLKNYIDMDICLSYTSSCTSSSLSVFRRNAYDR